MKTEQARRLKRSLYPMPDDIHQALLAHGLLEAYQQRPAYQQNDYIGWITRGRRPATREKRLRQMLDELVAGDSYMRMAYHAKTADTDIPGQSEEPQDEQSVRTNRQ